MAGRAFRYAWDVVVVSLWAVLLCSVDGECMVDRYDAEGEKKVCVLWRSV